MEKIEKMQYKLQREYENCITSNNNGTNANISKINMSDVKKLTCPKTLCDMLEASNDPEGLLVCIII